MCALLALSGRRSGRCTLLSPGADPPGSMAPVFRSSLEATRYANGSGLGLIQAKAGN